MKNQTCPTCKEKMDVFTFTEECDVFNEFSCECGVEFVELDVEQTKQAMEAFKDMSRRNREYYSNLGV